MADPRSEPLVVIGAGAAGLVTAQILLKDGFQNVQVLTRHKTVGGVWSEERVYPSLTLNNVHGEFRFSSLPMSLPVDHEKTGGHLTGEVMRHYFQDFADKFLQGRLRFSTEVIKISRREDPSDPLPWSLLVRNEDGSEETLKYSRVILCTGGCSVPRIPPSLSPDAAREAKFIGPVVHSVDFGKSWKDILTEIPAIKNDVNEEAKKIVIIGGGKSAQDMATHLASQGRKVTVVFETADSFCGGAQPLPDFLRKSRVLAIMSPHIELKSRLERFLHTTWLGARIVENFWKKLQNNGFDAFSIPAGSPLRNTHSIFWSCRLNDEGNLRDDSYFAFVNSGKIDIVAPARVSGYVSNGVVLEDGRKLEAHAVLLATGYDSSWRDLFDDETAKAIGINRHAVVPGHTDEWPYTSLSSPPPTRSTNSHKPQASSIYRGLVPAKNILRRDFAVNGAVLTTNNGYAFEVSANWISSYFLNDRMHLPRSVEEALEDTERTARWINRRWPNQLTWLNESYSAAIYFLSWPQYVEQLLEDLGLPSYRSGGNWLTWAFQVVDLKEIENLTEERKERRLQIAQQ